MRNPALPGLCIAFFILVGMLLMGQAAPAILQVLGPAVLPEDVHVIDSQTTVTLPDQVHFGDEIATLPDDFTVLDPQADAATSDQAEVVERTATSDSSDVQSPVALAAAVPTAAIAHVTLAPTSAVSATTVINTPTADNNPAPLFSWEREDGSDAPEAEVIDVQPAQLGPPALDNPTRIVIPSIHVDSPIVNVNLVTSVQRDKTVSTWQVARNAVGFHSSSAPLGTKGNTVMSAHNNVWGRVFHDLVNVKRGDVIEVYVGDRLLQYKIEDKILVRQSGASELQQLENAVWIGPTSDERLTLVSCWPYRHPTHRVIIIATPA